MDVDTVARRLYAALGDGVHGEGLAELLTEDVRTVEHPNRLQPHGSTRDRDAMLAASVAGAALLSSQRYDVHEVLVSGDRAAVRCSWSAVVGRDAGPFVEGQQLRAELAQFLTVRGGRVASIETYDCYPPWD